MFVAVFSESYSLRKLILLFLHKMKKRFLKFYVLNILFFFLPILLFGQIKEIGTPSIKNYPRKITLAGQQNWMIDQDSSGIMYFANNEGLLEFNGFNWKKPCFVSLRLDVIFYKRQTIIPNR